MKMRGSSLLQLMQLMFLSSASTPKRSAKTYARKQEYEYKQSGGMNLNQRQKRKRWASNPHLRP